MFEGKHLIFLFIQKFPDIVKRTHYSFSSYLKICKGIERRKSLLELCAKSIMQYWWRLSLQITIFSSYLNSEKDLSLALLKHI